MLEQISERIPEKKTWMNICRDLWKNLGWIPERNNTNDEISEGITGEICERIPKRISREFSQGIPGKNLMKTLGLETKESFREFPEESLKEYQEKFLKETWGVSMQWYLEES